MKQATNNQLDGFSRGITVSDEQLIRRRWSASTLKFSASGKTARQFGSHRSVLRGRGLEFQELREYQAGDEIRHLDWKVTARTGVAHTKLFQEERERPVMVAVDQRSSMYFGSRHCFKSVLAAEVAATIAWAGLQRGDRVGGLVFSDQRHAEVRPKRDRRSVLHLLHRLGEYNRALKATQRWQAEGLSSAIEELRRITKPGSTLFLITDMRGLDAADHRHIKNIAKHSDLIILRVTDPLELRLPSVNELKVTDGQSQMLVSGDRRIRDDFEQATALAVQEWECLALSCNAPHYHTKYQ